MTQLKHLKVSLESLPALFSTAPVVYPIDVSKLSQAKLELLKRHPDLLDRLDEWLYVPDKRLAGDLRKLSVVVQEIYRFNKEIVLYRGLNPANPWQDHMGLTEKKFLTTRLKPEVAVGYGFTYRSSNPLSFTTDKRIPEAFGSLTILTRFNPVKESALVITDELCFLISERRKIVPETSKEVVLLPPFEKEFSITQMR